MQKRLTKSQDKILAGVFGGIANYFNVDPTWVRIIGAALIIFTGFFPGTLFYKKINNISYTKLYILILQMPFASLMLYNYK